MTERIKKLMGTKLNNKGFSLVELLIVIAIMGVLAVIAFNAFGGVLTGSKKNADRQQARNIERAVRTLITDSGVANLKATGKFYKLGADGTTYTAYTVAEGKDVINMMMDPIYVQDPVTNTKKLCGPYLARDKAGNTYEQYAPQWNPDAGGQNVGWVITIDKAINNCIVTEKVDATATTFNTAYAVDLVIN